MSDYKQTIFLPQTSFAMKANLREREPEILRYWQEKNIYKRLREKSKGKEKFILHVGPPYANGHLHVGHALSFILKDVVARIQQLLGKDVPMVPGWDCHGLPIEWKVEESYREKGKSKEEVPLTDFRAECRAFAARWVDIQREEFKRLGLIWDWDHPYITMDYEAEAAVVEKLLQFLEEGSLYKGVKPVLWSVVEKTALAEAEVEYEDKTSPFVYVRFPVVSSPLKALEGVSVAIWTTTPWTLPGNRAISYGVDISYGVYQVDEIDEGSEARRGEKILIAEERLADFTKAVGLTKVTQLCGIEGIDLKGTQACHPFRGQGYDFLVPLLSADHVTIEAGTGLVHTAPGHGLDDFDVCKKHGIEVPETVGEDGLYAAHLPLFAGQHIFKADSSLLQALRQAGALLKEGKIMHSYPHSWRSKAPLIYRTTPQWFISMEKTHLRQKALDAIEKVKWIPAQGKNRLRGMIETKPDWCISRQRAWGVPITVFVNKKTGQPLRDAEVNQRILEALRQEGADAWFTSPAARFLGDRYDAGHFNQVQDILDVWFDSGSTHYFVLEKRPELKFPASLYLEGSDQHRGWFQSSLLIGCVTRGKAPYEAVLTHGFTVDEQGRKMSKSVGNTLAPEKIIETLGAEILRLWVVGCDFVEDVRVGSSILKHQEDLYRRYRNTLRYLLGALNGFQETERLPDTQMPELERWVLHRLYELQCAFKSMAETYEVQGFYAALHAFCAVDLSAFYFDIRKDVLYCDSVSSLKRRATRTVIETVFRALVRWLSPVLCFTTEEAWQARYGAEHESLQFATLEDFPEEWNNPDLAQKVETLREQRRVITGALENARTQGLVGSSLQAEVLIYDPGGLFKKEVDFTELAIVSKVTLFQDLPPASAWKTPEMPDVGIVVRQAPGEKCQRCWRVLEEVGCQAQATDLCRRCDEGVSQMSLTGQSQES